MSEVKYYFWVAEGMSETSKSHYTYVTSKDFSAAQSELSALREELANNLDIMEGQKNSIINLSAKVKDLKPRLTAAEQRNEVLERDTARIDWLIEQPVDTLYLDDGRIIDIAGRIDLRDAIDEAMAKPTESGASE